MVSKNKWSSILILFGVVAVVILIVKGNTPEKNLSITDVELDTIYRDLITKQEEDTLTAEEIKEARNTIYKIDFDAYLDDEEHPNLHEVWLYIQNVQLFDLNLPKQEKMYRFLNSLWSENGHYVHESDNDNADDELFDYLSPTEIVLEIYDIYEERSPFVNDINSWMETVEKELDVQKDKSHDEYVEKAKKIDELIHSDKEIADDVTTDTPEP